MQAYAELEPDTPGTIQGLTYALGGKKIVLADPSGLVTAVRYYPLVEPREILKRGFFHVSGLSRYWLRLCRGPAFCKFNSVAYPDALIQNQNCTFLIFEEKVIFTTVTVRQVLPN